MISTKELWFDILLILRSAAQGCHLVKSKIYGYCNPTTTWSIRAILSFMELCWSKYVSMVLDRSGPCGNSQQDNLIHAEDVTAPLWSLGHQGLAGIPVGQQNSCRRSNPTTLEPICTISCLRNWLGPFCNCGVISWSALCRNSRRERILEDAHQNPNTAGLNCAVSSYHHVLWNRLNPYILVVCIRKPKE